MSDENPGPPKAFSATARRVLGVLVEKAKTTPDNYPLSLAAIITGCNQKSNRDPKMDVDEGDALRALDELREAGATREIQGSGRVTKYRHAAYEWFGVDSPGASILTELLLRGPQTVGEIRTRASRMHPFADLAATQDELDELIAKGWVEAITPAGRGQLFTHRLYTPLERQHLAAKIGKRIAEEPTHPSGAAIVNPAAATDVANSVGNDSVGNDSAANESRVDRIEQRLDEVTARLAALEEKLAQWES